LSRDESNLVMKVTIVKELMTGDVSPVAMFFSRIGNVQFNVYMTYLTILRERCKKTKNIPSLMDLYMCLKSKICNDGNLFVCFHQ